MRGLHLTCLTLWIGAFVISGIDQRNFPPGCSVHEYGKKLQCRGVGLEALPKLNHLGKIEIADFSENNIRHILQEDIESLRQLQELYVDHNPFHCCCQLDWLRSQLLDSKLNTVRNRESIRCATPLEVRGRPLYSLTHVQLCGTTKNDSKRDINNCDGSHQCDLATTTCVNSADSFKCLCQEGFERVSLYKCVDINECEQKGTCHSYAVCENTNGSFRCTCKKGYHGAGGQCGDIDECKNGNHNCDEVSSKCINTAGSFHCKCKDGFKKKGDKCVDIDECAYKGCGWEAACTNTVGGFECFCNEGWRYLDMHCFDVDECQLASHGCNRTNMVCQNTLGSYSCECQANFIRSGDDCFDIDECTTTVEHQTAHCEGDMKCRNIPGSFECECDPGYKPDIQRKCKDINECKSRLHNCSKLGHCQNTLGSFECFCPKGFSDNGYECTPSELTRWMTFKYLSADLKNGTWDRIVALIAASVVGVAFIAGLVLIVKKVCGKLQLRAEALRQKTSEEQAILGTDGHPGADMYFTDQIYDPEQMFYRDPDQMFFPDSDEVFFLEEGYGYYPGNVNNLEEMYLVQQSYEPEMVFSVAPDEIYDPTQMAAIVYQEDEEDKEGENVEGPYINEKDISFYDYSAGN